MYDPNMLYEYEIVKHIFHIALMDKFDIIFGVENTPEEMKN